MGLVSPLGLDVATSWAGLLAGRSGIGPLPAAMRECRLRCRVCGVAPEFDAKDFLPRTHRRTMGRVSMLACLAAKEAVAQAGLDDATLSGPRTSVCAGSTPTARPCSTTHFSIAAQPGSATAASVCCAVSCAAASCCAPWDGRRRPTSPS